MALVKAGRDIRRSPLQFDRPTLTHILVGNDLSSIPAHARHQRVTLEVLATGLAGPANLEVRFNDTVLAPAAGTGPLPYAVSPALGTTGGKPGHAEPPRPGARRAAPRGRARMGLPLNRIEPLD